MLLDQGFQLLFGAGGLGKLFGGSTGGTGGGWLSGLFSGIGNWFKGLFGFAGGGSFTVGGGSNKMDNNLVAFRASAGETMDIHRGGQSNGADGGPVSFNVNVEGANGDQHVVDLVRQGVEAGLRQYDRQMQGAPLINRIRVAQARAA